MKKLSALPGKPANHRRSVERAVIEVDEIDAPLARRRIVEPQRLRFDVKLFVGPGDLELLEVGVAIEQ